MDRDVDVLPIEIGRHVRGGDLHIQAAIQRVQPGEARDHPCRHHRQCAAQLRLPARGACTHHRRLPGPALTAACAPQPDRTCASKARTSCGWAMPSRPMEVRISASTMPSRQPAPPSSPAARPHKGNRLARTALAPACAAERVGFRSQLQWRLREINALQMSSDRSASQESSSATGLFTKRRLRWQGF
jgi:hypothetical protein